MKKTRPILLVEDDKVDAMTVIRAMGQLKVTNELIHKHNGVEAIEYLKDNDNRRPCIILLDLNMPKMNGIEFLKTIKELPELKQIPVVVLTTSKAEEDVVGSFNFGVSGYIVKPVDYSKFVEALRTINIYWTLSELPGGH